VEQDPLAIKTLTENAEFATENSKCQTITIRNPQDEKRKTGPLNSYEFIKDLMKTKTVTITKYTTDLGVELSFKPANDKDVIVTERNGKIYVQYLVQDEDSVRDNPNDRGGDDLFLVNYHRDFEVTKDEIITLEEVREYYRGNHTPACWPKYRLFKLNAYIHSGVVLGLAPTNFPDERWDVSHVGLVLVSKKIWKIEKEARKCAECFVEEWNQYLSGDIWGTCTDVFDQQTKQHIIEESEAVWGCYGYEESLKQLKQESEKKNETN
jgi:hypothetical protein